MPSTHVKEFEKQCISNVNTRQMLNEIMSDKSLHCLLKRYNNFCKKDNYTIKETKQTKPIDSSV